MFEANVVFADSQKKRSPQALLCGTPTFRCEVLLRLETDFLINLLRAGDPLPQIEVRQTLAACSLDALEDHVSSETARFLVGIKEAVHQGNAIGELVT